MSGKQRTKPGRWRERFPDREFSSSHIEYLNHRYGRPSNVWRIPGLIFALLGIGWLIWTATYYVNPPVRFTLLSFQPTTLSTKPAIEIRYQIQRRSSETEITCRLVARDIDKNVVGEISDRISPANKKTVVRTVVIPARIAPVNAAVIDCR